MKGHSFGMIYRHEEAIHYIEFWEQPFLRWLLGRAYGLWERVSWRTMRRVGKLHRRLFERDEFYIPLTNRQDIKYDHLIHKNRKALAIIDIDQEQYNAIT